MGLRSANAALCIAGIGSDREVLKREQCLCVASHLRRGGCAPEPVLRPERLQQCLYMRAQNGHDRLPACRHAAAHQCGLRMPCLV